MTRGGGFAVLCEPGGTVSQVLSDSLGMGEGVQPGIQISRLAARGGLGKMLSFLSEINSQGAAFDWEINIHCKGEIKPLHFTGSRVNESLLVVGAENGKFARKLFEEVVQINNEQTNSLRSLIKENTRIEKDDSQFNEISRLNNELVSMQREIAKKNAELEFLNQEKNRFLGMAAHDLRNPLHIILMASEYLLSPEPILDESGRLEMLQNIHSSSQFMANLVDDLLDVSKIEAGVLTLDYSVVYLNELLARNAAINRPLASLKKIHIEYPQDPLPRALVDGAKIQQVLNNLVSNAVKFSSPGGRVEVRLQVQGDNFLLSIQDYGQGISPEQAEHMFKPFQRGTKGTGGEKSTGLGLVIVKRIVEGHGGRIWFESKVGEGTTFFVSIPLQPKEDST